MRTAILIAAMIGLPAGCGDSDGDAAAPAEAPAAAPIPTSLAEARAGVQTTLIREVRDGEPAAQPPADVPLDLVRYPAPAGELAAYLSTPPTDGARHPAIIWVFGGFSNSIGDTAWTPQDPENDQSASAFYRAGIVQMYPSFRGGNDNPGHAESFWGEVDDVLAAADYLAGLDYVDPDRIYLGGHSTGGTLVLLVAASTDRFRAVFSFGPVDQVAGYGGDYLHFDMSDPDELRLRDPVRWLHAIRTPTFVIEGSTPPDNHAALRAMEYATDNPRLEFYGLREADHFSILRPVNELLARKILADTDTAKAFQLTAREVFDSVHDP